jgi:hypothetical protein
VQNWNRRIVCPRAWHESRDERDEVITRHARDRVIAEAETPTGLGDNPRIPVMRLQLRYALDLIGPEYRSAARVWAKSVGKWAATTVLLGVTAGLTLFALLWAFVLVAWVLR